MFRKTLWEKKRLTLNFSQQLETSILAFYQYRGKTTMKWTKQLN